MRERIEECAGASAELVGALSELTEMLVTQFAHGTPAHEVMERIMKLAIGLRSDLNRISKYMELED